MPSNAPKLFQTAVMRRGSTLFPLLAVFAIIFPAVAFPEDAAPQRIIVSGTQIQGSNLTEPRPRESEFFKVNHAGFMLIDNGAAYYLDADVRKAPAGTNYVRIEFENPKDKRRPFVSDMELTADTNRVRFTSEQVVGIRNYKNYSITVKVFRKKDDEKPIDTLVQPLRAYVDTTTGEVRLDKRILPK